jgi:hypothetical protein
MGSVFLGCVFFASGWAIIPVLFLVAGASTNFRVLIGLSHDTRALKVLSQVVELITFCSLGVVAISCIGVGVSRLTDSIGIVSNGHRYVISGLFACLTIWVIGRRRSSRTGTQGH